MSSRSRAFAGALALALLLLALVLLAGRSSDAPVRTGIPTPDGGREPVRTAFPLVGPVEMPAAPADSDLPDALVGPVVHRCPLASPVDVQGEIRAAFEVPVPRELQTPGRVALVFRDARIQGDAVVITEPAGVEHLGRGHVMVPGFDGAAFTIGPDGCEPIALGAALGTVSGEVRGASPDRELNVVGCGRMATPDEGAFLLDCPAGTHELQVRRWDGYIPRMGPTVSVEVVAGEQTDVVLEAPSGVPHGRLGLQLVEADGGIGIGSVEDGGPAALAGLGAGDRILAVDGEPTQDMSFEDFTDRAIGPLEGEVTLTVDGPGGPREVTVGRARFPSPMERDKAEFEAFIGR